MDRSNHTPQRVVRIHDSLWDEFGSVVGTRNRTKVIRQFIAWYLRKPGAKLPARPGDPEFEEPVESHAKSPSLVPQPHALYRFFDKYGDLLYIGITMDLPARMGNHRREKPWWTDAAVIEIEHYDNRAAALEAERIAIKVETPRYNVVHNGAFADEGGVPIS
jgi:predicted GIY-YIG superfamily endonuclease